jgi:hypothetical protein
VKSTVERSLSDSIRGRFCLCLEREDDAERFYRAWGGWKIRAGALAEKTRVIAAIADNPSKKPEFQFEFR